MVSAANSFGLMDGGVDMAIAHYFGPQLVERVQRRILEDYLGEQPIGASLIVETGHPRHPYVAHTPTMRLPMPIATTDHAYVAMGAMLLALRAHNRASARPIEAVACPGLGTATGRMAAPEAARQMATAYRWFLNPPNALDWAPAQDRQDSVRRGGDLGLASLEGGGPPGR
jgi:O-acetyl-ADP-ribose deacetylase (regulator of RNase III)